MNEKAESSLKKIQIKMRFGSGRMKLRQPISFRTWHLGILPTNLSRFVFLRCAI